ncbi:PREDICTED: sideroflexin-1-like [Amphimedon queenslandica]|uniref:Sidoreflexin n=1 Tax=Amphimedon queenslandica TaxID=400682 RepID=A0A1X7VK47_AMPQE|nr:PREDICTED: sideroflexin-1-like [Amphimedon queenslandica]|eukprot:XP_003383899.1 PREDICTED: sideroflexin-1-like [Amphimedon queenslandica]
MSKEEKETQYSKIDVDLSRPRYDQTVFSGRAKHFFQVTDPRNLLATTKQLEEAALTVKQYKEGIAPAGITEDELWNAKTLYDSAYHPDTGEKMFILGRMSAQVPCNMTITGLMMTFYKHPAAVFFWQWTNQSFNAIVNYTNRSGDEPLTPKQVIQPYIAATTCATATAIGLNVLAKNLPPLIGRFVPFAAVAAANCVNIPLMRQREINNGIPIVDSDDNKVGVSKNAAKKAIAQVCFSRIVMAMPGMIVPAIIMNSIEKKGYLKRVPWAAGPLQVMLVGMSLVFATPLCCAIFPQKSSISVSKLEPELLERLQKTQPHLQKVYFNKGL